MPAPATTLVDTIEMVRGIDPDRWTHAEADGASRGTVDHIVYVPRGSRDTLGIDESAPHWRMTVDSWTGRVVGAKLNLPNGQTWYDGTAAAEMWPPTCGNGAILALANAVKSSMGAADADTGSSLGDLTHPSHPEAPTATSSGPRRD